MVPQQQFFKCNSTSPFVSIVSLKQDVQKIVALNAVTFLASLYFFLFAHLSKNSGVSKISFHTFRSRIQNYLSLVQKRESHKGGVLSTKKIYGNLKITFHFYLTPTSLFNLNMVFFQSYPLNILLFLLFLKTRCILSAVLLSMLIIQLYTLWVIRHLIWGKN